MKFNFWKKDKNQNQEQKVDNSIKDNSDVSRFYDYDKVAHNPFLTSDEVKSKYVTKEENINHQTAYSKKYNNQKTINMQMDEIAFKQINDEIKSNIKSNHNEFENLRWKANDLNHAHKIPVKKRSLFSRNENDSIKDNHLMDSSDNYNIVEDFDRKYDDHVDYYDLSKQQTKLLNLDELFDENKDININNQQPIVNNQPINSNGFYIDKTKASNLTNRLFEESEIEVEQVQQSTPVETIIPRKTIRLSNDNSSTFITLDNAKNNLSSNFQNTINFEKNRTNSFVINNNQTQERVPTTALRYLTPVEEDDVLENSRIKKENRRLIKFKD